MSVHIRIATIEDIPDISYLGKTTFDQSFGYLFKDKQDLSDYLDRTFSEEKLRSSIAKPNNVFWIVFYEQKAVGYAKIQLNTPSEFVKSDNACKLQKLYLLQDYLSKGIGGQLQQLILEKAKESGDAIWLSVLKENTKAVAFYQRDGYKIAGEHPFSIGKEDFQFWVMSREL
ncbi:GNAT family N-acetyltransferase [Aquimarina litoralis]|uniref:GNAT family N-acetyltransferase n=1 Tax=Aquimarina litoralis TaxID=584605 RepID=UPI001C587B8A|nr:GNAT family N-acetyltransferase [Aquimarina litoralis]MBW1298721.1 GNAT family N-acetyltransferase [Aquimarina litoralis]